MKFLPILLLTSLLLWGCRTHRAAFSGTALPELGATETPHFDAEKLADFTRFLEKFSPTTGMLVLHQGKQVYQYGDIKKVSYIASCRKSVLSMLYGPHVENGTVDLNATIGELGISEKDSLLAIEKKAKVDHLITSRSGVFHVAANGGYDKANFLERGAAEPGTYFVYNNWDFNVAGFVLEQYTGKSVYELLEEQLAIPLGFEDWNLKNQKKYGNRKKSQYPAYHIYVSTRDMAKIGQLMLQEGEWNGKQLISKEWIRKTTSTVTPHETLVERHGTPPDDFPKLSYSYMWWLIDSFKDNPAFEGAYTASGYGGQFITVLPAVEMVVAHKTVLGLTDKIGLTYNGIRDRLYYTMLEKLVSAKLPTD